jgi:hypothetical protein
MTGDFIDVNRVIVSERLLVPVGLAVNANEKALAFKRSISESARQERLIADISVKALGENRQTFENTDNRKREFSGDTRPGVESDEFGHRWETAGSWEKGKRLVISPSYESKNGLDTNPNIGWIEPTTRNFRNFDEMLAELGKKPIIQLTKYKVNPKTDDVDEQSAKVVDSFAITPGLTFAERQAELAKQRGTNGQIQEKVLPGKPLSERVPGGSLIARAAGRFGIIRDELNKFRCPPGTPAANQFTDMFGTNCFGFSASRFARFTARKAQEMLKTEEGGGFLNNVRSFLNFVYKNEWTPNVPWAPVRMGRHPYFDSVTGERIDAPDWRTVDVAPGQRLFRNGLINSQDFHMRMDDNVNSLYTSLGVDRSEAARAVNADVVEAFEALNKLYETTGGRDGWDVNIANVSGLGDNSRLRPEEVTRYITARLSKLPNWSALSKAEQERMIASDTKRYYETERAYFETALHLFKEQPSVAKFFGRIEYNFFTNDEAGTSVYGDMRPGRGGIRGVMHVNLEKILTNQESMLPDLMANERLAISALGAISDSAAKSEVADFLINSEYAARHMAGLVDGPKTFTRHIAFHEFSHGIQSQAFIKSTLRKAIEGGGKLEIPQYRLNKKTGVSEFVGMRVVKVDFDPESGGLLTNLTGSDIMNLMMDVNDGLDLKHMSDALSRSEVAAFLAGKYPTDYTKGSEIWGLEVGAELWALREQGLIFGDDVDAALEWMDDVDRRAASSERAELDAIDRAVEETLTFRPPSEVTPDETETVEDMVDVDAREAGERRRKLKEFKEFFSSLSEEEMLSQAAMVRTQQMDMRREVKRMEDELRGLVKLDGMSDDEFNVLKKAKERDIERGKKVLDYYEKMYNDARTTWRKKYGVGSGATKEMERFDAAVGRVRIESGILTDEEVAAFAKEARFEEVKASIEKFTDKEVLRRAADIHLLVRGKPEDSPEVQELMREHDALRTEFIKRAMGSDGEITPAKASRDFFRAVEKLLEPKEPAKVKKFKSQKDAALFGQKERARLRRKITKEQAAAIVEMEDFSTPQIAQMFDQGAQSAVGRAINARNARMKRLGLKIDPTSADEGSLEDQVKNIIIPTMESIDSSSINEPFAIEAVIELPSKRAADTKVGKEINVDSFTAGRVTTLRQKPLTADKKKSRIIINVREGDRGVFPKPAEGKEQAFVIPPGSIRIIGKDKDGTIRAEISRQKDTVEVLDSLVDSIKSGTDDRIWRDGNAKKIRAVADKAIVDREKRGVERPYLRMDDASMTSEINTEVIDSLANSGSSIGETFDVLSDAQKAEKKIRETKRAASKAKAPKSTKRKLSSGQEFLGEIETRDERRKTRVNELTSNLSDLRSILSGNGSKDMQDISEDMLDPAVAEKIRTLNNEQISQAIENAAFKMHTSFDRRVRVRMYESELDDLAKNGKVRAPSGSVPEIGEFSTRRAERLARMTPEQRASRLSSGRVGTKSELEERMSRESEVAARAASIFDSVISAGKNIDDMSDDEITKTFGTSIKRSPRKAISLKHQNTYVAEDVPSALALMALGHHVSVENQNLTLTTTAQLQLEKQVTKVARLHIRDGNERWLKFKKAYEEQLLKSNPLADINDKQVITQMKKDYIDGFQADLCALYKANENLLCSGHIGIDREKMPQTNGRTKGADTVAIRMFKDGKAKGKWVSTFETQFKAVEDELNFAIADGASDEIRKDLENRMASLKTSMDEYDAIKKRHPTLGKTIDSPLSEDEKQWMYSNTDWNDTEVNLEDNFIAFLNKTLTTIDPQNGPAVRKRTVNPNEYAPSQQQLVASKVAKMAQDITKPAIAIAEKLEAQGLKRGTKEFRDAYLEEINQQWFMSPILATMDKYILDGHHRWAGINIANNSLDADLNIPLNVNEVQTDIVEGLTLGRAFQEVYGIKEARLGAENRWKVGDITEISDDEISSVAKNLEQNISAMADELYERGDFIQVGAVGYKANPDYKKAVQTRRSLRAAQRSLARDIDTISGRTAARQTWFSSGATDRRFVGNLRQRDAKKLANARAVSSLSKAGVSKQQRGDVVNALSAFSEFFNGGTSNEISRVANTVAASGRVDLAEIAINELQSRGLIDNQTAKLSIQQLGNYPGRRMSLPDRKKMENVFTEAMSAYMGRRSINEDGPSFRTSGTLARINRGRVKTPNIDDSNNSVRAGIAPNELMAEYYSRIGLSKDIDTNIKPVSGYLVNKSHIEAKRKSVINKGNGNVTSSSIFEIDDSDIVGDSLTAQGDIEIVLKPEVANRTSYGLGDSLNSAHRPVSMNSVNRDDIVDAYINSDGHKRNRNNLDSSLALLSAYSANDYSVVNGRRNKSGQFIRPAANSEWDGSRAPFEAQILGGFDADEIEQVNYPLSKIRAMSMSEDISDVVDNKSIAQKLRSAGFSEEEIQYFYSVNSGEKLNTQSMSMLRDYRAAKKVQSRLAEAGFANVKFVDKLGTNIEDPRTYSRAAEISDNVEDVLRGNINREIIAAARKLLDEMRKEKVPNLVTRRGSML